MRGPKVMKPAGAEEKKYQKLNTKHTLVLTVYV